MVEFEGKTVRVDLPLPLPTLTDIQKIFSDRFNLDFVPEIRYLDEEISRIYITVDDVKHFPRSSRLLKLSKGPLSWWLWERLPMQSWKTHGLVSLPFLQPLFSALNLSNFLARNFGEKLPLAAAGRNHGLSTRSFVICEISQAGPKTRNKRGGGPILLRGLEFQPAEPL